MTFKKVFFGIGIFILCLLVLLVGVVGTIWIKPSILINEKTLAYGQNWLRENTEVHLTWDTFEVESSSPSFWVKSFSLATGNFCFNNPEFIIYGCFDKLALGAQVDLENFSFKIDKLDKLIAQGEGVLIDLRSEEAVDSNIERQASAEEPMTWEGLRNQINGFLQITEIGNVAVTLNDFKVLTNSLDLVFSVAAEKTANKRGEDVIALKLKEETVRGELKQKAQADLELSSSGPNFTGQWSIAGDLNFDMPEFIRVEAALEIGEAEKSYLTYDLDTKTVLPVVGGADNAILAKAKGRTNLNHIAGELDVVAKNFLAKNSDILVNDCKYAGAIPYMTLRGQFELGCRLVLPVVIEKLWSERLAESGKIGLPPAMEIKFNTEVDTQLFAATGEPGEARIVANIEPWREKYLGFRAAVDLGIRGTDITQIDSLELTPNLDASLEILAFDELVAALNDTPFAIPAPLNSLSGRIVFQSKGTVSQQGKTMRVPLELVTNLKSREQQVKTKTQGYVSYSRGEGPGPKVNLNLNSVIQSLHLQLPEIDPIAGLPALVPDSRIQSPKGVPLTEIIPDDPSLEDAPPFFAYDVRIKTANPRAIVVKSNLLDGGAPIELNLALTSKRGMTGYVNVHDAKIEYLRRTAQIEHLRLIWPDKKDAPQEIDGLIQTTQQDVDVFIEMTGTTAKPQYTMWSNPDLPSQSIMALLLFNRPVDQLNTEQSESAGNVSNAVADGAIGLLGMWAFATTPIQSVAYNPETQVYSASVDVGGGASLTLGSDWDKTQTVQLRKRLSPNWILTTSVEPNRAADKEVGEMVLQWQNRY